MTEPNDPSELWVALHKSGRPASVWSEQADAVDAAAGWNAHVTPYVPASELTNGTRRVVAEYPTLNPSDLEPYYARHVAAMTAEGLHAKADIAAQLAWRDQKLAELKVELLALRSAHAKCPTCVHGVSLHGKCQDCDDGNEGRDDCG